MTVAVRAKGDSRDSKRRQFVVSKRRLSEQKETNANAPGMRPLMLVGPASATAHESNLRGPQLGAAWRPVNNGPAGLARLSMPLPFQAPKRKIPGGLGDSVPQMCCNVVALIVLKSSVSPFANYTPSICLLLKTTRHSSRKSLHTAQSLFP